MKKHVIHKNQIIITSLAILIAVAGYLSYDEHASRTSAGETGSGVRLERSTEIVSLYDGTEMDSWISGEEPHSIATLGKVYLPVPVFAPGIMRLRQK